MQITPEQTNFVRKYWWYAVRAAQRYDHNPTYMLAQSVAERGWNGSTLSDKYNNFFGVTKGNWTGPTVTMPSGLVFRVYPSLQASFDDYAKLLTYDLYKSVIKRGTPEQFAHTIAYSPYISEVNGDNRAVYKNNILRHIEIIRAIPKPLPLSAKIFIGASVIGATVWVLKETKVITF